MPSAFLYPLLVPSSLRLPVPVNQALGFMSSKSETEKVIHRVVQLAREGNTSAAALLLRNTPLIFEALPLALRSSEAISLAAISRHPSLIQHASERLRQSIPFFLQAFAKFAYPKPSERGSATDLLFILEFSRRYHQCFHAITEEQVRAHFSLSEEALQMHLKQSCELVRLVHCYESWLPWEKEASINHLKSHAPGFSESCYEYAYTWAYSERSSKLGEWRW